LAQKYAKTTTSPYVARYWAMCEWFDETCGDLLAHLEREGLAGRTIVIYLADNGWIQAPEREVFAPKNKTTPFDLGHRTPVLLRWPGRVQPARSASLASSLDIMPTICVALGLSPPAGLPGIDLLDASALRNRQYLFGECFTIRSQTLDDPAANLLWRWATDGQWRLIVPRTAEYSQKLRPIPSDSFLTSDLMETLRGAKPLLYNLDADPAESRNLAEENPAIVARLGSALNASWVPQPAGP
jgi:uncharacterized sulfatase